MGKKKTRRLTRAALLYMAISLSAVAADTPRGSAIQRASAKDQALMGVIQDEIEVNPTQDERLNGTTPSMDGVGSHRPMPGEKLGYSRELSLTRLPPSVLSLFDAVLRLYREPRLMGDRARVLRLLKVTETVRYTPAGDAVQQGDRTFRDTFVKGGVFDGKDWSGFFFYWGTEKQRQRWKVELTLKVDRMRQCIDSRAVEGYLDLYLYQSTSNLMHGLPPERWDRHGVYGAPYALPLSPLTPSVNMYFAGGCLTEISLNQAFLHSELSNDKVF